MIDAICAALKAFVLVCAVAATALSGVLIFDAIRCGVYPVAAFFAATAAVMWVLVIDMIKH